jgi:hypothetical protein
MPRTSTSARIASSKLVRLTGPAVIAGVLLVPFGGSAVADDHGRGNGNGNGDRAVRLLNLAPIPPASTNTTGGMFVFDISFVDQKTQTYYLADRSNGVVDVVDAETGTFVKQIAASPPFRGFSGNNGTSGPNGVVAAFPWLFVTDASSRVVSIDLRNGNTVGNVSTGGADSLRADELAFDPQDGLLLVINNADTPPFATLIAVDKTTGALSVKQRITLSTAASGVDAENGAEQPLWNPGTGRFYLSIPQIGGTPGGAAVGTPLPPGAVIRINPISAKVEASFPVNNCGPAGLSLGPSQDDGRQDALIGCNTVADTAGNVWDPNGTVAADPRDVIINLISGKVDAEIFGAGAGDEVWFNAGDNNYYATGSGSPQRPLPAATASGSTPLAVIDAKDEALVGFAPTFNEAAVTTGAHQHPAGTSHSIAANAHNNLVFVPLPANNTFLSPDGKHNCLTGCVAVFGHPDEDGR